MSTAAVALPVSAMSADFVLRADEDPVVFVDEDPVVFVDEDPVDEGRVDEGRVVPVVPVAELDAWFKSRNDRLAAIGQLSFAKLAFDHGFIVGRMFDVVKSICLRVGVEMSMIATLSREDTETFVANWGKNPIVGSSWS